jgi:hypothetical protein
MRNFLITLVTAVAVVAGFLLLRRTPDGDEARTSNAKTSSTPAESPKNEPPPARPADPARIEGLPDLEVLHRRHGTVGAAMRDFLGVARGDAWNLVDRRRMQELIHKVKYAATEADIAYLLDLFNRTPDPAFRWWFSWLVLQLPDERFLDALTEVYRLDPHRAVDTIVAINTPAAMERYLGLMESETDPLVRRRAVVALAHSDWEKREEAVTAIARDQARAPAERMEALAALGRMGFGDDSIAFLMDVALGPPAPAHDLDAALLKSHPAQDVRSAAILAVMQRGDQESARRLLEAADQAGAKSPLAAMVDVHVASFQGPDLSEFLYDRIRRRGFASHGEVSYLVRDLERADRARLRDILPLVQDESARATLQRVLAGG